MITENQIENARENFYLAAKDFEFVFHSPYSLTDEIEAFGYIENYGSKKGTIICLTSLPGFKTDNSIIEWCKQNNYFYSFLNIELIVGEYKPAYFREMLRDWGHFK